MKRIQNKVNIISWNAEKITIEIVDQLKLSSFNTVLIYLIEWTKKTL